MKLKRHEEQFPPGDPRTITETRIVGDRDYQFRAMVGVEVSAPLTRAEIEAMLSLVVLDLVDGNVKAGGERYDDLCLAYAHGRASVEESRR